MMALLLLFSVRWFWYFQILESSQNGGAFMQAHTPIPCLVVRFAHGVVLCYQAAIVQAVTHYKDPEILAKCSEDLGEPMRGLEIDPKKITMFSTREDASS